MPVQLRGAELPILVKHLDQYLPEAIRVQSDIRSVIGGFCDGQSIWVDQWPEAKAVVCVVDSVKGHFGYWRNRLEIYATTSQALESVLKHESVVDWTKEFLVAAVNHQCMMTVTKVAQETKVGIVKPFESKLFIYYLPDDKWHEISSLPQHDSPDGLRLCTVDPSFSTVLSKTWEPEGGPRCENYIRALIEKMPSVALYEENGGLVGYCLLYYYWALALLYVTPTYRGKGIGSFITREMITKMKSIVPEQRPYLVVATANKSAISMYEQLGFQRADSTLYWFLFEPYCKEQL